MVCGCKVTLFFVTLPSTTAKLLRLGKKKYFFVLRSTFRNFAIGHKKEAMTQEEKNQLEERIVDVQKTVYALRYLSTFIMCTLSTFHWVLA